MKLPIWFFCILVLLYTVSTNGECDGSRLMDGISEFKIKENSCSVSWKYKVEVLVDDTKVGSMQSKCPSWNIDFTVTNTSSKDNKFSVQVNTAFKWGKKITITDCFGLVVAIVEERDSDVIVNGLTYNTKYTIKDDEDQVIGFIKKSELFDTEYSVRDMNDQVIMSSKLDGKEDWKRSLCMDPIWNVKVHKQGTPISPEVIIAITGHKAMRRMANGDKDPCTQWVIAGIVIGSTLGLVAIISGIVALYLYFR